MQWVLERLPADMNSMKQIGFDLRRVANISDERGDGHDRQCAGSVTDKWLASLGDPPRRSMWQVYTRGHGGVLGVPVLYCQSCNACVGVRTSPGPKFARCLACVQADRRARDRKRKRCM